MRIATIPVHVADQVIFWPYDLTSLPGPAHADAMPPTDHYGMTDDDRYELVDRAFNRYRTTGQVGLALPERTIEDAPRERRQAPR